MEDFQFLVTDDRYSAPTLKFVRAQNAERARQLALRLLADKHHQIVEVWDNQARLFVLTGSDWAQSPSSLGTCKATPVGRPDARPPSAPLQT